jgi:two-component system chemotaxis response regulator CheB
MVRAAAQAHVRQRTPLLNLHQRHPVIPQPASKPRLAVAETIVAIGASTGGTEALTEVLSALPADAPGVVVVQHMPEFFTNAFARRLNDLCQIEVREGADADLVVPGRAIIAPGNRHLSVVRRNGHYQVDLSDGPLVSRHRPSVDILFHSIAAAAAANSMGIILTGMGKDGACGMLAMKQAGSYTVAQDENSCVVFGMPKEAIAAGGVDSIVSLDGIPEMIMDWARRGQSAPFHKRKTAQHGFVSNS